MQVANLAVFHMEVEHDGRGRGDQIKVVFALEPVADHLEMQQAKETAAKTKAEGGRGFHFRREGGIIELKLFDGVAQGVEVVGINREQTAENHRLRGLEAWQGFVATLLLGCNRVADTGVANLLDRAGPDADLSGAKFGDVDHLRFQDGQFINTVDGIGLHHLDAVALADHPVDDADHDDDAKVAVIPAVDQHRLQRRVAITLGRGQSGYDGFQDGRNTKAGFGRDFQGVGRVEADDILYLLLDAGRFCGGQVNLVQDGHNLVPGIQRMINVGQRLRLDPLTGIDHQKRAFDRAHRAADLIGEVDVAGGVDQVQDVGFPILRRIFDPDGVGLDRDAALALNIH